MSLPDLLLVHHLTGPAHARGKRTKIAFGCLGEAAEHPLHGICQSLDRRGFHGFQDIQGKRAPIHEMITKTAEDQGPQAMGVRLGKKGGNPGAHRIAHHIGGLDLEMIEKRAGVFRHLLHGIVGRIVQFFAASVPSIVVCDDPAPCPGQGFDPLRKDPVHRMRRSESHE